MTGNDLQLVADDLVVLKNVIRGKIIHAVIEYPSGTVNLDMMYGDGDEEDLQVDSIY